MTPVAEQLAAWAAGLEPSDDDLALARRSLVDTVAVAIAARAHPIGELLGELSQAEAWGVLAHVLDFDDLHMASTSTRASSACAAGRATASSVKLSIPGRPSSRVAATAYWRLNLPSRPVVGVAWMSGASALCGVRTTTRATCSGSASSPRSAAIGRCSA